MAKKKAVKQVETGKVTIETANDPEVKLNTTGKVGIFTSDSSDHLVIKSEPSKPVLIQWEVDEELKEALSNLGAIQSKYQQLGVSRKARGLRGAIRSIRHISSDWR